MSKRTMRWSCRVNIDIRSQDIVLLLIAIFGLWPR
jgi:hypothetical protein